MAYTLKEIQQKVDETFKGKGLKVTEFVAVTKPLKISCPKHGQQTASSFDSFIRSKHGCPECGKEASASHAAKRMVEKHSERAKLMEALYSIPDSLSDAEFRHRATEIINALKRGNYL